MIKLAKTLVLDDREFLDASSTLNHIFDAIRIHLNDLEGADLLGGVPRNFSRNILPSQNP